MANQREQQLSARMRSLWATLRPLFELAWVALAITLVVLVWNDAAAATGEISWRIFLVGWAMAAIIPSVESLLNDLVYLRGQERAERRLPPAVHYMVVGMVIGLAVGTTDWTDLPPTGFRQPWLQPWLLTVLLLLVYANDLVRLRRHTR